MIDKLDNFTSKKMQLAEKLSNEKKYEESLQICDEIIMNNQNCYSARKIKGRNFYALGRFEEAFQEIEQLVRIRPNCPSAYYLRARWNLQLGNNVEALEDVDIVIHTGENYFLDAAYFYKSLALLNLSNKKEALTACLKLPNDFKYGIKTPSLGFKVMTKNDLQALIEGS